jgi:serine phosphatase RsbU (regulator of sigma subunit)
MTGSNSSSDPAAGLDVAARRRVRISALGATLAAAILVLLLGARLSQPLFDLYQNVSPAPPVSRQAHVVVIDAESLQAIGGWPWSRYYLARLVEEIAKRGATAIGLDLLMPEPDRLTPSRFADLYAELPPEAAAQVRALPSMDAVFARVIGRSPVVLARAGVRRHSFDALDNQAALLPPEARFSGPLPSGVQSFPLAVANLPLLDGAALGHGLVNGDPDDDGVVRRVPLVATVVGQPTPGFALELVRVAHGLDRIGLTMSDGRLESVQVGDRALPASADGRLALRFGDWRKTPTTSAADLLREGLPADLFKGQIVLVGLTGAGTSDVINTPRASQTYGVFVQAQAVDAILRGDGLRQPGWARPAAWALGVLMALGAWALVSRWPIALAVAAGFASVAAVLAASWAGFLAGLLLDPFPALLPAIAAFSGTVAALFVEGRRLQARLRSALEDERVQAARVAGELAAAADIQSGMLLPRAELGRLSPSVDLDAVLQPARHVGGDLYDAFTLADGRLCFLVGDVTGKGVPAALFMALSKSLARSLITRPDLDLAAAMAAINVELSRDNREDLALTLLVGVLTATNGEIELCCAGHENPFVAKRGGEVYEWALRGGPPLCVDADFPYDIERHRLAAGETLIAFTDGLTEAQAPGGELLPRDALLALVGEAAQKPTAAASVDAIVAAVRAFEAGSEPSDDLTVLAVRLSSSS